MDSSDRPDPRPPVPPDANPVRRHARQRRQVELIAWWVVVLVLLGVLIAGGPWFLIIPIGAFGALVAANTVALVRGRDPEEQALTAGRLVRAATDHDPVSVSATWSPRRRAPERQRHDGRLTWTGHRLVFVVDGTPPARGRAPSAATIGLVLLDATTSELRLGPPPTLLRPQVVVIEGTTTHVLDLCPGWDIASIGVGVLLAAEWYRQLTDLGVTTS